MTNGSDRWFPGGVVAGMPRGTRALVRAHLARRAKAAALRQAALELGGDVIEATSAEMLVDFPAAQLAETYRWEAVALGAWTRGVEGCSVTVRW